MVLHSKEVSEKLREYGVVPMIADWSDKKNWVIGEFLDALEQPAIPYYPLILPGVDGAPGRIIALPSQLSPPATLQGKSKFIEALEKAMETAGSATVASSE